jgi:hypothetical protein
MVSVSTRSSPEAKRNNRSSTSLRAMVISGMTAHQHALCERFGRVVGHAPATKLCHHEGGLARLEMETDLHWLIQFGQRTQPSSCDGARKVLDDQDAGILFLDGQRGGRDGDGGWGDQIGELGKVECWRPCLLVVVVVFLLAELDGLQGLRHARFPRSSCGLGRLMVPAQDLDGSGESCQQLLKLFIQELLLFRTTLIITDAFDLQDSDEGVLTQGQ